jgi:hypothetical protein
MEVLTDLPHVEAMFRDVSERYQLKPEDIADALIYGFCLQPPDSLTLVHLPRIEETAGRYASGTGEADRAALRRAF